MYLRHLALPVADQQRSREFYETYLGFGASPARQYPDGVLFVYDAAGFHLAFGPATGPPPHLPEFLHHGFACADADEVRRLKARLLADGVPIVEDDDEEGYVAFKCLDPDGYRVEVYWEP